MPNTPLFVPARTPYDAFLADEKIIRRVDQLAYHRLKGFGHVQRNDAVVFNFPEGGDTVVLDDPTANYYDILRQYQLRYGPDRGREALLQQHEIITRPVDKRENYIKRAVALPGDTLQVIHSDVFVNGQPQSRIPNKQYVYFIRTDGTMINPQALEDMGIAQADINYDAAERTYIMPLTEDNLARISKMRNVTDVVKYEAEGVDPNVFPQSPGTYPWNADNFGPLWIPSKGATVQLTEENLPLYRRIIEIYEGNSLEVKNGVIYINGKPASKYTFGMDYYFMMGGQPAQLGRLALLGVSFPKTTSWARHRSCCFRPTRRKNSRRTSGGTACSHGSNNRRWSNRPSTPSTLWAAKPKLCTRTKGANSSLTAIRLLARKRLKGGWMRCANVTTMQRIIAMHGVSARKESFRANDDWGTFVDRRPADPRTDALAGSDRRADRGSTLLRRNETGRTGTDRSLQEIGSAGARECRNRTAHGGRTDNDPVQLSGHERCDAHRQGIAAADYRTTIRQPLR